MPAALAALEPRLLAYLVDRALGWGTVAGTAYLLRRLVVPAYGVAPAVVLLVATAIGTTVLEVLLVGLSGTSPGRALLGVRVVDVDDSLPIGPRRAAVRAAVVGLAGIPSLGLGLVALAAGALGDPDGARRGRHDRLAGSVVVDARPRSEPEPEVAPPRVPTLVNLTLLVPAQDTAPTDEASP